MTGASRSLLLVVLGLAVAGAAAAFPPDPPRLGLEVQEMSPELRKFLEAPEDAGVLVSRVERGSPAAEAGVQVGDVLYEAGGQRIEGPAELIWLALRAPEKEKLPLVLYRKGEKQEVELTPRGGPRIPDKDDLFGPGQAPLLRELREQLRMLEKRIEELEKKLDPNAPNRT
jgi:membrane-associated protease RseP (regulator of RpoE activity)